MKQIKNGNKENVHHHQKRNDRNLHPKQSMMKLREEQEEEEDDDLNIIGLSSWSRSNDTKMDKMGDLAASYDSTSSVQIHQNDISSISSIASVRSSHVLSNSLKYGHPNSKFQRQLMVNRLRRKRKYDRVDPTDSQYEPPQKKEKKSNIDLMSSRDLKNELKRIHSVNNNKPKIQKMSASLTRKNLLLRKSMPDFKMSKIRMTASLNSFGASFDSKRIKKTMKNIFRRDTESEEDDIFDK